MAFPRQELVSLVTMKTTAKAAIQGSGSVLEDGLMIPIPVETMETKLLDSYWCNECWPHQNRNHFRHCFGFAIIRSAIG